ncbi:MAG: hypothetical protein K5776_09495 [Lachnospiraceae bacterium]|nr:hypothetical protein [Lachnospiraceae bacterium]
MGKKRIIFSIILNIVCVITGLIYPVFALSYFGKMISLAIKGGGAGWMNFMALLLLIIAPIIALLVLPIRITSLSNILVANSKIKSGVFAKGNLIATGVLQFVDILVSSFGYLGVIVWIHTGLDKLLRIYVGFNYEKNYWPVFWCVAFILVIPTLVRAAAQIVSSIMLFTIRKTVAENDLQ